MNRTMNPRFEEALGLALRTRHAYEKQNPSGNVVRQEAAPLSFFTPLGERRMTIITVHVQSCGKPQNANLTIHAESGNRRGPVIRSFSGRTMSHSGRVRIVVIT